MSGAAEEKVWLPSVDGLQFITEDACRAFIIEVNRKLEIDDPRDLSPCEQDEYFAWIEAVRAKCSTIPKAPPESIRNASWAPSYEALSKFLIAKKALYGRVLYETIAAKSIAYIWEDTACSDQIICLFGGPSGGKTTTMALVIVARAREPGTPCSLLCREIHAAPAGKFIVLIEAEQSKGSISRKLTKSCDLLGINRDCLDRVFTLCRENVLVGDVMWHQVKEMIAAGMVADVFLDSLARTTDAAPNDEKEQARLFAKIHEAMAASPGEDEASKFPIWILAHTRKEGRQGGESNGMPDLEDIGGSQQRPAQMDTAIAFRAAKNKLGKVIAVECAFRKRRESDDADRPWVRLTIEGAKLTCVELTEAEVEAAAKTTTGAGRGAPPKKRGRPAAPVTEEDVEEMVNAVHALAQANRKAELFHITNIRTKVSELRRNKAGSKAPVERTKIVLTECVARGVLGTGPIEYTKRETGEVTTGDGWGLPGATSDVAKQVRS